jgi:PhnB protein
MTKKVNAIPEGHHSITPSIIVRDSARAINFYKQAFGAQELGRLTTPDGKKIVHAELKIGDSIFFLSDEFSEMGARSPLSVGGTSSTLHLYLEDVDAVFQNAVDAGAKVKMPPQDMFWGDRYGKIVDPSGHEWGLASHREDISQVEMEKRSAAFFNQMAKGQSA